MINFFKKFDLPILFSLIALPLISIIVLPIYIYNFGIVWQEPIILIVGWFLAGTGITVGYHRLFAHKSFKVHPFIEWFYMITGSMALQNTILNWCSDHRRHHKKLDTSEDPYSITKGFLHAHIGWIVKKNKNKILGVSDLLQKKSVKFQSKYYWGIALFLSFILPIFVGLFYNRPFGALLWGGVLRVTLVHHFTFFINSFCHFIGKKNYDINTSARDSSIMAVLTFGEGYHNFHHRFQWDYRNGIKWYSFDPSKWIIKLLSIFKIAHGLRRASNYNIFLARVDTINEKINTLSNYSAIKKKYKDRVKEITKIVLGDLKILKKLESNHKFNKQNNLNYKSDIFYTKKKFYQEKIKESINLLRLIFYNLKNQSKLNQFI